MEGERLSPAGLLMSSMLVIAVGAFCLQGASGPIPPVALALGLGAGLLQIGAAEVSPRVFFSAAPALTLAMALLGGKGPALACAVALGGLFFRALLRRPTALVYSLQTNLAEAVPELVTILVLSRGAGWAGCLIYVPLAVLWPWITRSAPRTTLLGPYAGVACAAILAGSLDLATHPLRLLPLVVLLGMLERLPVRPPAAPPRSRARGAAPLEARATQAERALESLVRSQESERLALLRYQHEHHRLEEELQRLQSLLEGTRQMASTLDFVALGERLEAMLRASVPHEFGAIFTLEQEQLHLRRQWGATLDLPAALGVCQEVLAQEIPLTFGPTGKAAVVAGQTALLAAPMQLEQGTTGVLLVGTAGPSLFEREHQDLLWMIGCLAAISFSNASLHQEVVATQAQLVHAGKLAAIGQLAAGVAHELNTPLGAIQLAIDGVSRQLKEPAATVSRKLDRARLAADQAREIVDKLLVYSRRDVETDQQPVELSLVVTQALELVQAQLKRDGVQLEVDMSPAPAVMGNSPELRQVLTNLLMNARDAALSPTASAPAVKIQVYGREGWVYVRVLDQGPGVAPELERRIFEPFFTTKPVGRGTGLGLSISHRIAAQHGGALEYESAPGGGACFTLRLPAQVSA